LQAEGKSVSHCQLRYIDPFPKNLGVILGQFDKVLIPELNLGQLRMVLRAEYLVDAIGLNKVQGKPFSVAEITAKIRDLLKP
jgi:2-oxoglutarate ferredoxin oxidoreductase subunit alpha